MKQLAINIKAMRKKRKITQAQLAEECKVSGAAVSQWESATNPSSPEIPNLIKMAQLFRVPVEILADSTDIDNYSVERTEASMPLFRKVFDIIAGSQQSEVFNAASPMNKSFIFTAFYGFLHEDDSRDLAADDVIMKALGLVKKLKD